MTEPTPTPLTPYVDLAIDSRRPVADPAPDAATITAALTRLAGEVRTAVSQARACGCAPCIRAAQETGEDLAQLEQVASHVAAWMRDAARYAAVRRAPVEAPPRGTDRGRVYGLLITSEGPLAGPQIDRIFDEIVAMHARVGQARRPRRAAGGLG